MKKGLLEMKNPFIITPGEFWANRESLWNRIVDRLELARHTRSNEIIVLTGTYGCGTTHTLKYLKRFLDEKGAVAAYIPTTVGSSLQSLYRRFFQQISPEKRELVVDRIFEDLLYDAGREDRAIRRLKAEELERVRHVLTAIISGRRSARTISLRDRRILDEVARIPTTFELWNRVILDLATEEWPVFVLFDEFDVALLGGLRTIELIYNLRRLYDESLVGLCIMIGLKGEPKDVKEKLGDALYSRMTLRPIHLHLLSKTEGLEFLKSVLEHARLKSKTKQGTSPYFPFTEKSIKTLIELTCPATPRRLLRVSSLIFEEARMEKLSIIDKDFVLEIAMKFGEVSVIIPAEKARPPKTMEIIEAIPEVTANALRGIVQFGRNGIPNILVDPGKLTAREVIGLMLYAKAPNSVTVGELAALVSRNWKDVYTGYITANLSHMRELILKEGRKGSYKYTLSGIGKSWIENELIPKLRSS